MINFFRKIRKKTIENKKVTNYLLYAFGEIILVMVGILLALQVNNWNETRKEKEQLERILSAVSLDLKQDTIVANNIVQFYDTIQKKSNLVIQQKVNRNNYKTCPECRSLVSVYKPFIIQKKGFELLKIFSNNNGVRNDTLVTAITQFYTTFTEMIENSNDFVKKEVFKNIESFKSKDWFVKWATGDYNKEMIIYFTESEEYRKMVASYDILASKNHKIFIDAYNKGAKQILKQLNKRLNNN